MRVCTFLATVLLTATTAFGAGPGDILGSWETDGGDSQLEVFSIIWVSHAALVAIYGTYLKARLLALGSVFFVGLADNAIRPLAFGAKSNIPVLAIVLGAIGGVFAPGILGLILGTSSFRDPNYRLAGCNGYRSVDRV